MEETPCHHCKCREQQEPTFVCIHEELAQLLLLLRALYNGERVQNEVREHGESMRAQTLQPLDKWSRVGIQARQLAVCCNILYRGLLSGLFPLVLAFSLDIFAVQQLQRRCCRITRLNDSTRFFYPYVHYIIPLYSSPVVCSQHASFTYSSDSPSFFLLSSFEPLKLWRSLAN